MAILSSTTIRIVPNSLPRDNAAIALYRFGHYGNAASVAPVAQAARVPEGLVVKCTLRMTSYMMM
jgi:hypothetical protein